MIVNVFYHSGFCLLNLAHHGSLVVAMPASKGGYYYKGWYGEHLPCIKFLVQSAVSGK